MTCQGCGATVPPTKNPGTPRKWCSENCRKRTWDDEHYRGECENCGGLTSKPHNKRCGWCKREDMASIHETRLSIVEGMWNDGWSVREIAAALGYGDRSRPPMLTELRRKGRIGYRYDDDRVANACVARWAA